MIVSKFFKTMYDLALGLNDTSVEEYSKLTIKETLVRCPPVFPVFKGILPNKRKEILEKMNEYKTQARNLIAEHDGEGLRELIEQNEDLFAGCYNEVSNLSSRELEFILDPPVF